VSLVGKFFRSSFHRRLDTQMRRVDAWLKAKHVPVRIRTPGWWWFIMNEKPINWVGRFKKRYKGVYNPQRWGFHVLGLEIGYRG
jgi:hypothetical protein